MTSRFDFDSFAQRLHRFIAASAESHASGADLTGTQESRDREEMFGALALELFAGQFEQNESYHRFCRKLGRIPNEVRHWSEIPALPTTAFKELAVSCLPPNERTSEFNSSGTSRHIPSRHFHSAKSLRVYEASLLPWFQQHLLPERCHSRAEEPFTNGSYRGCDGLKMLALTPPKTEAPRSSLVHMFDVVIRDFGAQGCFFAGRLNSNGEWLLINKTALNFLKQSVVDGEPVLLLGTAFLFVNFLDKMPGPDLKLPAGSRLLETGGYKGRSRECAKTELHAMITERLGIPDSHIAGEYGMSELSSQAYDTVIGRRRPGSKRQTRNCAVEGDGSSVSISPERCFTFPPWAKAQIISPETGREVDEGEPGLIRVFDLANTYSVLAIQTEDVAIRQGEGFELLGRAAAAEPRGCSILAADLS